MTFYNPYLAGMNYVQATLIVTTGFCACVISNLGRITSGNLEGIFESAILWNRLLEG